MAGPGDDEDGEGDGRPRRVVDEVEAASRISLWGRRICESIFGTFSAVHAILHSHHTLPDRNHYSRNVPHHRGEHVQDAFPVAVITST